MSSANQGRHKAGGQQTAPAQVARGVSSADQIRQEVSAAYARAIEHRRASARACCCGPAPDDNPLCRLAGYDQQALRALPEDAVRSSFGCGNPLARAEIREGEVVLDLGCGTGLDLLLAAQLTGPGGRVIGIDMTPAMIERARANAAAAGLENVEVLEGTIEELPVDSGSIDLVFSNCVLNLSPEKSRIFAEIYRVLKPGGRISISDIVAEPLPAWIRANKLLYSACIAGAIPEAEYLEGLRKSGLVEVMVRDRLVYRGSELAALLGTAGGTCCGSEALPEQELERVIEALSGRVASIRVVARKPELVLP